MAQDTKLWKFSAVDTLFFRDGTPYNAGEGGQLGVTSGFPPFMNTIQGAVRIALAYGQEWTYDNKEWPEDLGTPNDLGKVNLEGPYLMYNDMPIFRAPLFLMCQTDKDGKVTNITKLSPSDEVSSDFGTVRLPAPNPKLEGAKVMENYWLSSGGYSAILNGKLPRLGDIICPQKLWVNEDRVGIMRDNDKRTAEKGRLYSCVHVRPEVTVSVAVAVSGVPIHWHEKAPTMVCLGGEGRMAKLDIYDNHSLIPKPITLTPKKGKIYYTVSLLTPGKYSNIAEVIKNGPPGLPGECVSACIGKMLQIGGWDSENREPKPLEPLIPAGSTWFFEVEEDKLTEVNSWHGKNNNCSYGYGQIAIGKWEG